MAQKGGPKCQWHRLTHVLLIRLKYQWPLWLRLSSSERAVFLLAVESHVTPGMTPCNINRGFLGCDGGCHTTSLDFLMAQHKSILKIIPNTCKQKWGEQHFTINTPNRVSSVQRLHSDTCHDYADSQAHSSYDVKLGVKHLLNGIRAALQHANSFLSVFMCLNMTWDMPHIAASQWWCRLL